MLKTKSSLLFKETAEITGIPAKEVTEVLTHYFQFIRHFVDKPSHPALELPNLAVIYPVKGRIYLVLEQLVMAMRKYPNRDYLKRMFRNIWYARHTLTRYCDNKKYHGVWSKDSKYVKKDYKGNIENEDSWR